jgi:hypothetical protein
MNLVCTGHCSGMWEATPEYLEEQDVEKCHWSQNCSCQLGSVHLHQVQPFLGSKDWQALSQNQLQQDIQRMAELKCSLIRLSLSTMRLVSIGAQSITLILAICSLRSLAKLLPLEWESFTDLTKFARSAIFSYTRNTSTSKIFNNITN